MQYLLKMNKMLINCVIILKNILLSDILLNNNRQKQLLLDMD